MKLSTWSWLLVILIIVVGTVFLFGNMTFSNSPVTLAGTAVPPVPTLDAERLARGKPLYAQHCASCHGVALQGVADWKKPLADGSLPAPPHDSSGHTWHHEDSLLLSIIANGGDPKYNSKMPAFQETLTEEQMAAILEFIKISWGREEREFQWWMTATRDGIKPTLTSQRQTVKADLFLLYRAARSPNSLLPLYLAVQAASPIPFLLISSAISLVRPSVYRTSDVPYCKR